ncbi:hypothetical protein PQR71_35285 [Paraburkholderia fungorum]|uniref:hypothetical protein n=1 Tax=Paraburkholderia fungorum TaxID=134537 RepID=UPI0038BACCCE
MYNVLDADVGLAVEVLEGVDREITSLLLVIKNASPARAAFFSEKLAAKRAQREQLRARFVAAAQLVQQPDHPADVLPGNDREYDR